MPVRYVDTDDDLEIAGFSVRNGLFFAAQRAQSVHWVTDPEYGPADPTGVADSRAAFAAVDALAGERIVPAGTYKIASNITLVGTYRFQKGAVLQPAAGVTVTLGSRARIASDGDYRDLTAGGSFVAEPPYGMAQSPPILVEPGNRVLYRQGTNTYYVFTGGADGYYRLHTVRDNVVTATESLGGAATPWRGTTLVHVLEVLLAYKTVAAESGSWANVTLSTGVPAYNAGTAATYRTSSTIGAWIEFTVTVPEDGRFNVGFLMSAASSNDVDVSVDGVIIDTLSLVAPAAQRFVKEYQTTPGQHTIRLTNGTAGSTSLHVLGINFSTLRDYKRGRQVDAVGYYRNTVTHADYISNTGAQDYAVFDEDAQLWGGSYHGGETGITSTFRVDGAATALAVGQLAVGTILTLEQASTIDWTAQGGGSLAVRSRWQWSGVGRVAFTAQFHGSVLSSAFYSCMTTANPAYTDILFPTYTDLSAAADLSRHRLGRTSRVVHGHPTTGQRIVTEFTVFGRDRNGYDGPHIWRVAASYNKLYYGPVALDPAPITDVGVVTVWTYE